MTEITEEKKILTKFSEVNVTKSQEMLDQFDKSIESYIKMSYCESTDSRNITQCSHRKDILFVGRLEKDVALRSSLRLLTSASRSFI